MATYFDLVGTVTDDPTDRPAPRRGRVRSSSGSGWPASPSSWPPCSALVAVAAFAGGEPFLAVMGAVGCLMTLWVGALSLFRG